MRHVVCKALLGGVSLMGMQMGIPIPAQAAGKYAIILQAGIAEIVCDFCAGAFAVKERLAQRQVPTTAEYAGHPSIAKWADQGYEFLVL